MAALPYIQLYVADYLADTAHLTAAQHGAYLLLIFNYWQRGKPLNNSNERLANVARMSNDEWEQNKHAVAEFFDIQGDEWVHHRIEVDLAAISAKSTKAQAAGRASAEKRSNVRSTSAQQTLNHTDTDTDTDKDTEQERVPAAVPAAAPAPPKKQAEPKYTRKPPKTPMPADFALSDAVKAWAATKGHQNLQEHFDSFVGKVRANGYCYVDWDQALQNAIRDDWAKLAQRQLPMSGAAGPPPRASRHSGFENIDYSEGIENGRIT